MSADRHAVWARLRSAGAVSGEMTAAEDTPWYLAAVAGIAAWIAAVFLSIFFFELFDDLWRTPMLAFPIGAGCCVFAILLLRHLSHREFFEQFAIAVSLVGQLLIGTAFERWSRPEVTHFIDANWSLVWIGVGAVALAMYAIGRTRMHRFLCAAIFAVALIGLCLSDDEARGRLALPLLAWLMLASWWRSTAGDRFAIALPPMAWALSLFVLGLAWFSGADAALGGVVRDDDGPWIEVSQALVLPLLPVCAYWLLARQAAALPKPRQVLGFAVAAILACLWWRAPGVSIGVSLSLIGFALYRPALVGVGILGLMVYLLRYYYQLDVPLIEKSYWLLAGGAAILIVRWYLLRVYSMRSSREEPT